MGIQSISALKRHLLKSGVAYRHVVRYIRELQQHHEDLFNRARASGLDEQAAMETATRELGNMDALADAMISRPELRSLGSRYPRTVFILTPLLLYLISTVGLVMLLVLFNDLMADGTMSSPAPGGTYFITESFRFLIMHLLAPLTSCVFLVYGMRQAISGRLLFAGVFLLNLFSCALLIRVQYPDAATGDLEGFIGATVGYGLYGGVSGVMATKFRLLITLAFLGLFAWCVRSRFPGDEYPK